MSIETTQCPKCRTVFRITPQQLEAAGGWVRCGRCGAAFDATRRHRATPPILEEAPDEPASLLQQPVEPVSPGPRPAATPRDPEAMLARARHALHVAEAEEDLFAAPRRRRTSPGLWLGSFLLLVTLAAQAAWFHRESLLRDPRIGPRVAAWCRQLGCDPGPVRAPERLALQDHAVTPHPDVAHAVRLSGTLVNESPFAQPCPDLRLSFLDAQGSVVASRRFTPAEYLPVAPTPCLLPPDGRRTVRLDLADPGVPTLAYRFEFL